MCLVSQAPYNLRKRDEPPNKPRDGPTFCTTTTTYYTTPLPLSLIGGGGGEDSRHRCRVTSWAASFGGGGSLKHWREEEKHFQLSLSLGVTERGEALGTPPTTSHAHSTNCCWAGEEQRSLELWLALLLSSTVVEKKLLAQGGAPARYA